MHFKNFHQTRQHHWSIIGWVCGITLGILSNRFNITFQYLHWNGAIIKAGIHKKTQLH